jgi:hypothetical protein
LSLQPRPGPEFINKTLVSILKIAHFPQTRLTSIFNSLAAEITPYACLEIGVVEEGKNSKLAKTTSSSSFGNNHNTKPVLLGSIGLWYRTVRQ